MHYAFAPLALAGLAAALPQGVTSDISPPTSAPANCMTTYPGTFNIQLVNTTSSKRSLHEKRQNVLALTLNNGILKDEQGRTGYIASNQQFQFDAPPQAGAIYTSGFAVCPDNHLYLGDDPLWYSCLSGSFYNIYDMNEAEQCTEVYIMVAGGASSTAVSVRPDGQPTGTVVSQQPDGQPTGQPIQQINDGQIQQASTPIAPVTQISDGQVQAPTSIAAPVTQIGDGQVQAPTSLASPISQISDGQIQAPTGTGGVAPPAYNTTVAVPSMPVQTGAASAVQLSGFSLVAAIFGFAML